MTRSAFLRVYVPVSTVEPSGSLPSSPSTGRRPRLVEPAALLTEPEPDEAIPLEWAGETLLCPRHNRLRMLEGLLAFHSTYASLGASLLIPEETAKKASRELDWLRARSPDVRSHILTSPWHVPIRWFSLFDPADREFIDGETATIKYRTELPDALARLERTLGALDTAGFAEGVIFPVEQLRDWLDAFPPEAVIELDYGQVAELFEPAELVFDESGADVWESIEALERGNLEEAGEHYMAVASRWAPMMAIAISS